jgi:hypothetical protein
VLDVCAVLFVGFAISGGISLADFLGVGPEWATPLNTFLLIILALITWKRERSARRRQALLRQDVKNTQEQVEGAREVARESMKELRDMAHPEPPRKDDT